MSSSSYSSAAKSYALITVNYWAFTLTDGALRMLVLLHFYQRGYSPLQLAMLFLFYEMFGVITNLIGGWLGARWGLNRTMQCGLVLQVVALLLLCVPDQVLSVSWVMGAQGLSGIAKDLNKMSAKSSLKVVLPESDQQHLLRWVSRLTGSKNALKGVGYFLGGFLLSLFGFRATLFGMALMLLVIGLFSAFALPSALGKSSFKPKFRELISSSRAVNVLSAARLFLFGAREVWFVVALPLYLVSEMGWRQEHVGALLALWIVVYGVLQATAPGWALTRLSPHNQSYTAAGWATALALVSVILAVIVAMGMTSPMLFLSGLFLFAAVLAVNSSLHSYLIVAYAKQDGVSLDVGFYYTSNALGRLLGTLLSGWIYHYFGLSLCLGIAVLFLLLAALISFALPPTAITISSVKPDTVE